MCPLCVRLGEPRSLSEKEKISFSCLESKRHSSVLPSRRAVALPTDLLRLRSQASIMSFYTLDPRISLLLYASVTAQ